MGRIIHRPRTHPAVDIALEASQYVVEGYVRGQMEKAEHNAAAARRAEAAAAAARRAEAAGDRDWERIVARHRSLMGGSGDLPVDAVAEPDDARVDLRQTLVRALDGFVLDEESQRVVELIIEPWIESALNVLPEDAGVNTRETMIVGAIVRLMALYDRATRERAGGVVESAPSDPPVG